MVKNVKKIKKMFLLFTFVSIVFLSMIVDVSKTYADISIRGNAKNSSVTSTGSANSEWGKPWWGKDVVIEYILRGSFDFDGKHYQIGKNSDYYVMATLKYKLDSSMNLSVLNDLKKKGKYIDPSMSSSAIVNKIAEYVTKEINKQSKTKYTTSDIKTIINKKYVKYNFNSLRAETRVKIPLKEYKKGSLFNTKSRAVHSLNSLNETGGYLYLGSWGSGKAAKVANWANDIALSNVKNDGVIKPKSGTCLGKPWNGYAWGLSFVEFLNVVSRQKFSGLSNTNTEQKVTINFVNPYNNKKRTIKVPKGTSINTSNRVSKYNEIVSACKGELKNITFNEFYTKKNGKGTKFSLTKKFSSNATYYANLEVKLTFDSSKYSNSYVTSKSYGTKRELTLKYGAKISSKLNTDRTPQLLPEARRDTQYTSMKTRKWVYSNGKEATINDVIKAHTKLTPVFPDEKVKIKFENHTGVELGTLQIPYNATIAQTKKADYQKYENAMKADKDVEFLYFVTSKDGVDAKFNIDLKQTSNKTYRAKCNVRVLFNTKAYKDAKITTNVQKLSDDNETGLKSTVIGYKSALGEYPEVSATINGKVVKTNMWTEVENSKTPVSRNKIYLKRTVLYPVFEPEKDIKITFVDYDGREIGNTTVPYGKSINQTQNAKKTYETICQTLASNKNVEFRYFTTKPSNAGLKINLDTVRTEDIIFYAYGTVNVKYDLSLQEGARIVNGFDEVVVKYKGKIDVYSVVEYDDNEYCIWYMKDSNGTYNRVTKDTVYTKHTTLYFLPPHKGECTVKFYAKGANGADAEGLYKTIVVPAGKSIEDIGEELPEDPDYKGVKKHKSWNTTPTTIENGYRFTKDTVVVDDTNVYSVSEVVSPVVLFSAKKANGEVYQAKETENWTKDDITLKVNLGDYTGWYPGVVKYANGAWRNKNYDLVAKSIDVYKNGVKSSKSITDKKENEVKLTETGKYQVDAIYKPSDIANAIEYPVINSTVSITNLPLDVSGTSRYYCIDKEKPKINRNGNDAVIEDIDSGIELVKVNGVEVYKDGDGSVKRMTQSVKANPGDEITVYVKDKVGNENTLKYKVAAEIKVVDGPSIKYAIKQNDVVKSGEKFYASATNTDLGFYVNIIGESISCTMHAGSKQKVISFTDQDKKRMKNGEYIFLGIDDPKDLKCDSIYLDILSSVTSEKIENGKKVSYVETVKTADAVYAKSSDYEPGSISTKNGNVDSHISKAGQSENMPKPIIYLYRGTALEITDVADINWKGSIPSVGIQTDYMAVLKNKINDTIGLGYSVHFNYKTKGYNTQNGDTTKITVGVYDKDGKNKLTIKEGNVDVTNKYSNMTFVVSDSNKDTSNDTSNDKTLPGLGKYKYYINGEVSNLKFNYYIPSTVDFYYKDDKGNEKKANVNEVVVKFFIQSYKGADNKIPYTFNKDAKIQWGTNGTHSGITYKAPVEHGPGYVFWYDTKLDAEYDLKGIRTQ